jgi:phage-related protein
LKKARKNLQGVQDTVGTGLGKTQDLFGQSTKRAGKRWQQMASSAASTRDAVQEQYVSYQRKRQQARTLFRWGLVVGFVLALLYTPYPGSDVRSRLMTQWEHLRSYFASPQ